LILRGVGFGHWTKVRVALRAVHLERSKSARCFGDEIYTSCVHKGRGLDWSLARFQKIRPQKVRSFTSSA
jgi:hypothetical protein